MLWLLRRRRLFRVSGVSMQPTLKPGTLVFIDESAYIHSLPAPRDIVIARHPYQRNLNMLKRVQSVDKEGRCFLISDNPTEGTDSRTFGAIRVDRIIGKVTSLAITTAD
ncbi:nickel-type superoxide dismutase maturation protease [Chloroflexi bacterium TSY]|nr:nickel-type superoxide dismutase maturation protease [Chloroflexi bacterium TSY]